MPSPPKADEESLLSANHRPLSFALIMPISPYQVNKLFAAEAILQTVTKHCGLPKTTKAALTPLRSRTLNTVPQSLFFSAEARLNKACFRITSCHQRSYASLFTVNIACQCLRFSTSAAGFACLAAALIIDTV